ncbi:hypothetical protein EDB86DRAFT_2830830 [Lactarius hatsudake]|nr:hypothetical protein EDB86DRAFT_2830830 [Lactarius hatsudake]
MPRRHTKSRNINSARAAGRASPAMRQVANDNEEATTDDDDDRDGATTTATTATQGDKDEDDNTGNDGGYDNHASATAMTTEGDVALLAPILTPLLALSTA